MRTDILEYKEQILELINRNETKANICRFLKCRPQTLERYLKILEIEYCGNMGRKNLVREKKERPIEYYLREDKFTSSHRLKIRLIKEGLKEHRCECCSLNNWLDDLIPLELHHIDGNRFNNLFENIQLLCPNCHAKTFNHSGRSLKVNKQKIEKFKLRHFCECGDEKSKRSKTCKKCYKREKKVEKRPEIEILLNEVKEFGYKSCGRKYGVSDNCIRKWIRNASVVKLVETP